MDVISRRLSTEVQHLKIYHKNISILRLNVQYIHMYDLCSFKGTVSRKIQGPTVGRTTFFTVLGGEFAKTAQINTVQQRKNKSN